MTKIIIVAGGLATRMKPITEEIPKCLIDINGKPLILHQLEFLKKHGFNEIIFCVAHLADKVKEYFGDGSKFGLNIKYVQETKELMGTAGSVKLTENLIGNDKEFIVYYGDNLTNMNFGKFLSFHKQNNALATVCMRPTPENYKASSIITLDDKNKIEVFLEKPSEEDLHKNKGKKYINSGIYAFSNKIFDLIPQNTKYDFAKQLFPLLIEQNKPFYGYPTTEYFREIGRVEKYEQFLKEVEGKDLILA